ncbi:serine-protein kinase ATM isoform X2 [Cephus cinctus]|nr:serine-protein kinase ATM isoform X2 [Cephus cinctus]
MNQNEVAVHNLLQSIIKFKKTLNFNGLLDLYVRKVLTWTLLNFHTLVVLCESSIISDTVIQYNEYNERNSEESIRNVLIKRILEIPWNKMFTQIPVKDLCDLLIRITLKSSYVKCQDNDNIYQETMYKTVSILQHGILEDTELINLRNIEKCHLSANFEIDLRRPLNRTASTKDQKHSMNILFTDNAVECLVSKLLSVVENFMDSEISVRIMHATMIAKVASTVKELNMDPDNTRIIRLTTAVKGILENVYMFLADHETIEMKKHNFTYMVNILRALTILHDTSYDKDITEVITSQLTVEIVKNIYTLLNTEDDTIVEEISIVNTYLEYEELNAKHEELRRDKSCEVYKQDVIKMEVINTLMSMCCKAQRFQKILLDHVMKIDLYESSSITDLRIAMVALKRLTLMEEDLISEDTIEIPIKFLQGLFTRWRGDEEAVRSVLTIVSDFLKHVIKHGGNDERIIVMKMLNDIHNLISDKRYGPLVAVEFLKCLGEIAKLDPSFSWSKYSDFAEVDDDTPFVEKVLVYIESPFYLVQLEAVQSLYIIFSLSNVEFKWQKNFFNKLIAVVRKPFAIGEELSEWEKVDVETTRLSVALLSLAVVICASGMLQCEAVLALLKIVLDKEMNIDKVKKVLQVIANTKKMKEPCQLVEDNMNYILTHWLMSQYPLDSFPRELVRCVNGEEFYRSYMHILAPIKIQKCQLTDVIDLCNKYQLSFKETIDKCFPSILSWLLPFVCEEPAGSSLATCTVDAAYVNKIFVNLRYNKNEFESVSRFSDMLLKKLDMVLISLIEKLHDEIHFAKLFNRKLHLPTSEPLEYKNETVLKCLDNLKNLLPREGGVSQTKLIQYLACQVPSVIQRVFLHFAYKIYSQKFTEQKLKAFYHYAYFSTAVIQELRENYFDDMSTFIIRDISHTLLNLIKEDIPVLSELCCEFFLLLLKYVVPVRSNEFKDILSFIVTSLTPIVQNGKIPGAEELLKYLIVDKKEILSTAIQKLDSFPNHEAFREMREVHDSLRYSNYSAHRLEKEIEHFLKAGNKKNLNCSIEGLSHLRHQLSAKKSELKNMYNHLEGLRGFAEDCASSLLHKLIYRLVKLTSSPDSNIALEAAKCLGELGPADLTTMILYPEKSHLNVDINSIEMLTYNIVILLSDFLIDSDFELRQASANGLYTVFDSFWGQKLTDKNYLTSLEEAMEEFELRLRIEYVYPFLNKHRENKKHIKIDFKSFRSCFDVGNDFWVGKLTRSHNEWITNITINVIECFSDFYLTELTPVCKLNVQFCETILPRIFVLIVLMEKKDASIICSCINQFFHNHIHYSSELELTSSPSQSPKRICLNYESVKSMLNIVNFIRVQCSDVIQLDLDYINIAKAAQYCSAYFTSILYAELWCESLLNGRRIIKELPLIDYICEEYPEKGKVLQDILKEACIEIGDPDAIYGCGSSHLLDRSSRIQHYTHLRQWDKVMLAQDLDLCYGNSIATRGLLNALQHSGLHYLVGRFMQTIDRAQENIDDFVYDNAWRLADWNISTARQVRNSLRDGNDCPRSVINDDYNFFHFQALKSFHESNTASVKAFLDIACECVVKALRNTSLESSKTVYPKLSQLHMLREVEELSSAKPTNYMNVLNKWYEEDFVNTNDFQYVEPILSQRIIMYQIKESLKNDPVIKDTLINTYLKIAEVAVEQGYQQTAARALDSLKKQYNLPQEMQDQLDYQDALLSWIMGDQNIARFRMRNLMSRDSPSPSLRAKALRIYGNWMVETKSENPQTVIHKYYEQSIDISMSIKEPEPCDLKNLYDTQAALAQFADTQYRQRVAYVQSSRFESIRECAEYSRDAASNYNRTAQDADMRTAVMLSKKQSRNDVAELENIQMEKNMYLLLAMRYYMQTLQETEDHNFIIFRLVSLWLDNTSDEKLNDLFDKNLDRIASHKFIPLVPQLAPHLNDDLSQGFAMKIYMLLMRCAKEHPHHTLPVLLALAQLYKDYEYTKKLPPKPEQRVRGAQKLINELLYSHIKPIIKNMTTLTDALVQFANYEFTRNKISKTCKIPRQQKIYNVKDLIHTIVPSLPIDIKVNRDYQEIIGVRKYSEIFESVGGINAPKKVTCVGTDGISRNQLLKGKDDMRQDAVMQQVFTVMNSLLKASKETKRRNLYIRTYKVVPLTQRSGILEWCEDTLPIAKILVGSDYLSGVHKKYYPEDYTALECRTKISNVAGQSHDIKLKAYLDCCKHLQPAFHHFFTETYVSPETWFERRLAYVRSVATTSIIGYILGLGDRHLTNILIDKTTAEVIHIDFGIAFERGKLLTTPETIPFRLTRDLEVAMGVSGVEGVMRRSCEKTMSVLREQREIIITLLQVLLYDPLFHWAQLKNDKMQKTVGGHDSTSETNKLAERALLRVEQKLQGTEEGIASSVSGQVERLIQEARDPANLCKVYYGWQAYL